jgi:formylglycine-generating enzyme required for sulfatase activity
MSSLDRPSYRLQLPGQRIMPWILCSLLVGILSVARAADNERVPLPLKGKQPDAATEEEMQEYTELIEHTDAKIEMVPIKGGEFLMGSPDDEAERKPHEGPQHTVKIDPFWMGKYEITWDAYEVWMFDLDIQRRKLARTAESPRDKAAEEYQISQPTEPYSDMTFGMGKSNFPAICMTQFGARTFCQWLTEKTGRYYRLPTEAEWEYACRAGTTTAYSFGDDPADLDDYGWYFDNSNEAYQKVGQKKPNAWGLHDMHGNVAEWVLDEFVEDSYSRFEGAVADNPLVTPKKLFPLVVRGGSWDADPAECRSAARAFSVPAWQAQDPQIPKSIWYNTDALHVGFRIIRPLVEPSEEERAAKWDKLEPKIDRKRGR